ncbi:MAG: hypothetical protein ABSF26_18995 [Thermoguttaceae bacterium]|jgi:hypothetical protein
MLRGSLAAFVLGTGIVLAVANTASADSSGPGWLGVVVARGELKQQIESTPIVDRPNRPLHFYGNAVRRKYYRGASAPPAGNFINDGGTPFFERK